MLHQFYNVKVVNNSLSRKKSLAVPVSERGIASLENCLERWLAANEFQDWKCTSCSQDGSNVKKLVLEAVPELLIIQLKKFRKVSEIPYGQYSDRRQKV